MADDRIVNYIDRSGVKGDTEFMVASLREVQSELLKLKAIDVDLSGIKGLATLSPAITSAKGGFDNLETAVENVNKQMAITNGSTKELYQNTILYTKANNELTKSTNNKAKAASALEKAMAAEKKAAADASNSYLQLSKAYQEAALRAKNLQLELGKNSPIAKEATKDALRLGTELKALDASTGTFNRNVGNYGGALVEYGKKAFGFIRTAANIIPGLGLSGAFLLIFEGLSKVFSVFQSGISDTAKAQKVLNEVNREAVKGYSEELVKLTLVKSKLDDLSISQEQRKKLAEDYNKTAEEGNKIDLKQIDNIKEVNSAIDRQIEKIKQRATAKAAENILSKKQEELINAQLNLQKGFDKNKIDGIDADVFGSEFSLEFMIKKMVAGRLKISGRSKIELAGLLKDLQTAKKNFDVALKAAGPLISIEGLFTDTKPGKTNDGEKAFEQKLKDQFEQMKINFQAIIDINKKIADDQSNGIAKRIVAANNVYKYEVELIEAKAELEKKIGKKTVQEKKNIDDQANVDSQKAYQDLYERVLKAQKDFDKAYFDEDDSLRKKLDKGIQDAVKRVEDSFKAREKKAKDHADKIIEIEKKKNELLIKLEKEIAVFAITLFEANIERQKNALQNQIDLLEEKKAKDIEVANATIVGEQDKAAAIATIEARAAAQKEQLQRKQRDLDIRKAQFDKAQSIARIIQETALNVVKYIGNPVLAALAGAIGAVQLAAVIAQPIPRYKHGKNVGDAYEGPAVVDDGGKPEAIIREDGSIEIGGNKPRMTYVGKNDIVLPDANMLADIVLSGHMGGGLKAISDSKPASDLARIEKGLKEVVAAVKDKKELNLEASEGGLSAMWKHAANQLKYINDQTNW
jgi:hypothetical protein